MVQVGAASSPVLSCFRHHVVAFGGWTYDLAWLGFHLGNAENPMETLEKTRLETRLKDRCVRSGPALFAVEGGQTCDATLDMASRKPSSLRPVRRCYDIETNLGSSGRASRVGHKGAAVPGTIGTQGNHQCLTGSLLDYLAVTADDIAMKKFNTQGKPDNGWQMLQGGADAAA